MSSSPALSRRFWRAQQDLSTLATRDLRAFWQGLDTSDPIAVREAVESFLPDLVQTYGEIGASLALDFYEELRDASGDVSKIHRSELPDNVVPIRQAQASGRWAIGPLFSGDPTPVTALSQLEGVTKRLVLKPVRDTVRLNVVRDPDATGWRRIGDGDSCKFCRMLIGRGEVYSAETARFGAHDKCGCLAEPAWDPGKPLKVEQHVATKRDLTDADRSRLRAHLADHDV